MTAGILDLLGPRAKAFPVDRLRFFDLTVRESGLELVTDILAGQFAGPEV